MITVNRSRLTRLATFVALAATACAVHPEGESKERDRATAALHELDEGDVTDGATDAKTLPPDPQLRDYLRVAFHSDQELRARYWQWRAALERIPQEASPPNLAFNFSYLFSDANMTAWDRTTLGLSNDPMNNVPLPNKLATAGRRALAEARAAGHRFEAAKFKLQAEVTSLYLDLALHGEQLDAQERTIALLTLASADAESRLRTGLATQEEALRARDELEQAQNQEHSLHAQLPLLFTRMNVLLGHDPGAPVRLPSSLPEPRPLPASDDELIALAAERSPELAALAQEVAGREEALTMARQQWIPDFGLSFNVMGSVSQTLGGMVLLPVRVEAIHGAIAEAEANLNAAKASRERYARDLAASFVLDLAVLRDTERQIDLFERVFAPRAELIARTVESSHAVGRASIADVVMARRAAVETTFTLAQLRAEREKALAALESWSSVDVEALHSVRLGSMAAR
jgi:outer membrane protein TolC